MFERRTKLIGRRFGAKRRHAVTKTPSYYRCNSKLLLDVCVHLVVVVVHLRVKFKSGRRVRRRTKKNHIVSLSLFASSVMRIEIDVMRKFDRRCEARTIAFIHIIESWICGRLQYGNLLQVVAKRIMERYQEGIHIIDDDSRKKRSILGNVIWRKTNWHNLFSSSIISQSPSTENHYRRNLNVVIEKEKNWEER